MKRTENTRIRPGQAPAAPLLLLAAWLVFSGCAASTPPALRYERHARSLKAPLEQRVLPADKILIDQIHRTNRDDYGRDVRPRPASTDHPLDPLVRKVVRELHPALRSLAERYLTAVYMVEDDWGTASTDAVRGPRGEHRFAYIVLNLTALGRAANAWATWKENSTFRPGQGEISLKLIIEADANDDREGAVRFIFIHELGHVIGLGLRAHPSWEKEKRPRPPGGYPFVNISWPRQKGKGYLSRWKERFPGLHKTAFYKFDQAPLALSQAREMYETLAVTDFPSLYGSSNLWDDFAEAFAIYVHTRLLGKPYLVELREPGKPLLVHRSCIQTGACPRKAAFLKKMLGE